jgi:cell wall-associated NlpC family hydrolase
MPNVNEFITQCRSYLGTPFRHQGRTPGEGLDCIGVAICAAKELGVDVNDDRTYRMKPNAGLFLRKLREHCTQIDFKDLAVGDLLIFEYDGNPQHVAIVTDLQPLRVLHAAYMHKATVEHCIDDKWLKTLTAVFRINGLDR